MSSLRSFRLRPTEIVPLPRELEGDALFPTVTSWIIRVTSRWIPGAHPRVDGELEIVDEAVAERSDEGSGYNGDVIEASPPPPKKLEIVVVATPEVELTTSSSPEEEETAAPISPVSLVLPTSPTPLLDTSALSMRKGVSIDALASPVSRVSSPPTTTRRSTMPRARVPWPRSDDFLTKHGAVMTFFTLLSFGGFFATIFYTSYATSVTLLNTGVTVVPNVVSCTATFSGDIMSMSTAVSCGADQSACRPLTTFDSYVGVRCPANCVRDDSRYNTKMVRGDEYYTPDSKICQAAVHAGVLDDSQGGCFEARAAGEQWSFRNTSKNGVLSSAFGWFPTSIQFRAPVNATTAYCCE